MPRIDDEALECVVYLYPSEAAAEDGDHIGGSGFLFGIPVPFQHDVKHRILCVVTNKHVIDQGSMVVRINTRDGKKDIIPLDDAKWFSHPDGDDLALCPIGLDFTHHKGKFVSAVTIATKGILEAFDIGIGDEVFVVGRFINHEGKQRNLPSARFGNIAQMPWEPMIQENGFAQESYLIEARSIAGYSGSPVFVHIPPAPPPPNLPQHVLKELPGYNPKRSNIPLQIGPYLLGIDYCHLFDREKPRHPDGSPMKVDWYMRANTGMMGVIPAWKLMDIIDGAEMKKIREAAEKHVNSLKQASSVALDSASERSANSKDENPQHREDFTSLLGAAARKPTQAG